jgi:putative thioredoxin
MIIEQDGTPTNNIPPAGELIKNSNVSTFVVDVVEQSKTVPVIVNFSSAHSEPCMQMTAALEKLVRLGGGIVKMVNVNVEENQQLAAQLKVQTVPTVFGFKQGQPIDAFAGAQAENQIKAFIKRLTGNVKAPIEEALEQAKALLIEGEPEQARDLYTQVLAQEQSSGPAIAGLIRCHLASGELDHAKSLIEGLEETAFNDSDVQAAIIALELAEDEGTSGDSDQFWAKLLENENDHQARFDLALSLYGGGNAEEALEQLLEIIRRERTWNDDMARLKMLKIFEALGHSDPVTADARRNLSTVLFS